MNFKKLIAILCCISLCGCDDVGASYGYSSYSSTETTPVIEYEEPSYTEPLVTTASTTKATTAATTEKPFTGYVPIINKIVIDAEIKMVTILWEVPGMSGDDLLNEGYRLKVYVSDTEDSYGESHMVRIWGTTNISAGNAESGTYYYRVEVYNDSYSNISEPYVVDYVKYEKPKEEIHQYTHTFSAPEGCTVVADYTSALNDINNGKQPTEFYYTIYYTCPYCGHKITLPQKKFAYDRDDWDWYFSVRCGISSCPKGKETIRGTVYSYATQIS